MGTKPVSKWSPPPPSCYKINVDGVVFATQKMVGVGVLIQDEKGLSGGGFQQEDNGSPRCH